MRRIFREARARSSDTHQLGLLDGKKLCCTALSTPEVKAARSVCRTEANDHALLGAMRERGTALPFEGLSQAGAAWRVTRANGDCSQQVG